MVYRDDEQMIEGLYWEFDKQRSEKTRTERDIFKGKLRWALANAPSRGNDFAAIAQALNWERTEFDTLDELLEELRERYGDVDELVSANVSAAYKLNSYEEALTLYADPKMYTDESGVDILNDGGAAARECLVELDSAKLEALRAPYNLPPVHNFRCVPRPVATTHTLLHAGELYREVTVLLHTEQLVAWRTADGQEYSAPAHQVLLDPDEDGLAAAILSRIAGVEIAPEHMAELRAQMDGGVTHG